MNIIKSDMYNIKTDDTVLFDASSIYDDHIKVNVYGLKPWWYMCADTVEVYDIYICLTNETDKTKTWCDVIILLNVSIKPRKGKCWIRLSYHLLFSSNQLIPTAIILCWETNKPCWINHISYLLVHGPPLVPPVFRRGYVITPKIHYML